MEKLNIKEVSKTQVLCARVFFENQVYSTDMRFGFGYECYFDEDGICLSYYDGDSARSPAHFDRLQR